MVIPGQPTVAEIGAGKDLSTSLLPDYVFSADVSTTISERDITAVVDAETPTIGKVKGSLHLFRIFDSATNLPHTTDLEAAFVGLPSGWLIRRTGPPAGTTVATTQKVELANFVADIPQKEGGSGTGFLKLTVPLLPQGLYYPSFTLVA
jgi:hypothetical protein